MENKIGKNRQSPKNEEDYINAYLKANQKLIDKMVWT